jgi:hypothetical protein
MIAITGLVSNGNVVLDATKGYNYLNATITCRNSNGTGGTAMILGNQIELDNSAVVDCSGSNLGTPYNSQSTLMELGARLTTDSTVSGNGGVAVVWADNITAFYGSITSRGGRNSGDGGTVQACGALSFINKGTIDVSSTYGNQGSILGCP